MKIIRFTISIILLSFVFAAESALAQSSNFSYNNISEPKQLSSSNSDEISAFSFPITHQIYYSKLSHFQTIEGKQLFYESLQLEQKQLQLTRNINELRIEYASKSNTATQKHVADEILLQEKNAYTLQQEINSLKLKSNELEYNYWMSRSEQERNEFGQSFMPEAVAYAISSDYINVNPLNTKLSYAISERVPTRIELEAERLAAENQLHYKIQVGRYKVIPKSVQAKFNKFSIIRRIDNISNDKGETIYTIGDLTDYNSAKLMQAQIETEGFSKTKIVAFKKNIEVLIDENGKEIN